MQNTSQAEDDETFDIQAAIKEMNCKGNIVAGTVDQNTSMSTKGTPEIIAERWVKTDSIPDRDPNIAPKTAFKFDATPAEAKFVRINFTKQDGALTTVLLAQNPSGKGWFLTDHAGCAPLTTRPATDEPHPQDVSTDPNSPFFDPNGPQPKSP